MGPIKWVSTGGSPLIVIPVEIAHDWRGTETNRPLTEDVYTVWEAIRADSDFGRACQIADRLGALEVGLGQCLVLSDEPGQTAFLPIEDGGVIVRSARAELEEEVLRAVEAVPENAWLATPHRIDVGEGGLLLFDSACAGDELTSTYVGETIPWLRMVIPSGTYHVDTTLYQRDRLILHRLRRSTSLPTRGERVTTEH